MNLSHTRVVVVGLGASGLAAASLAASKGARVVLNDGRAANALAPAVHETARTLGAELRAGGHDASVFADAELVVVSPGVPRLAVLREVEARGVPVIGEIDFAARFVSGTIVGITGTNGKSTVTTLVGEMARALGRPVFVGGNLGAPLASAVGTDAAGSDGISVVELSSFQLERVPTLRCHVAVLLNITDDHLDRYEGFADYAAAKGAIFHGQRRGDLAITRADDPLCASLARASAGDVLTFGGAAGTVRVRDGRIVDLRSGLDFPVAELGIRGLHNVENACAAALTARAIGCSADAIADVLRRFTGLPHRMAPVRVLDGVTYYDDSKATNVGATVAAIDGLADVPGRIVLLAGGVDKGGSYAPIAERLATRGRALVLFGEAAPLIEAACASLAIPVLRASSLEDATSRARAVAEPGDVVLLAPACASFDMFRDYKHRGDVFADAVRSLPGGVA